MFAQTVQAVVLVPFFNINIIQKTSEGDGYFDYYVRENGSTSGLTEHFSIQTINGVGSHFSSMIVSAGASYRITQSTPEWRILSAECQSDNPNVSAYQIENGIQITAYPYSSATCVFTSSQHPVKTPIIIIPGVLGNDIYDGDQKLWADLGQLLGIGDSFMDPLGFKYDLTPLVGHLRLGELLKEPFPGKHFYDLLAEELLQQGYTEGQDLFTFPYDWRYGVSGKNANGEYVNEKALAEKIQAVRDSTGSNKVDVVAHSTGGLLVKQYVKNHPQTHGIGKAVFVGVPNTGAPKAVKVLLSGDNFGIPWLADEEMRKISQNLPVLYDLAPSRTYVDRKGSFFKTIDQKLLAKDVVTQHGYDGAWDVIVNDRGANGAALAGAEQVHTALFDDYDLRTAGVDLYNIVGCKAGTIGQIVERRTANLFGPPDVTYDAPLRVMGDGTVPLESATNVPVDANKKYYALNTDHGKMMSQNGIRQLITNILSGSTLATADVTQDIARCKLNGKAHAIYSPVNVVVTDRLGNRLGFASDGSVENTIPNASFEVFGDHKFFFLPTDSDQQYDIALTGTDTGTFTYKVSEMESGVQTKTAVFADLPVTTSLRGTVDDAHAVPQLILDLNADGVVDKIVAPTAVVQAAAQGDLLAPTTTAHVVGTRGAAGWYRSAVTVSLSAADTGGDVVASGIDRTYVSVDDAVPVVYTAPITIQTEGRHRVAFYSTDKNANRELQHEIEVWVDTTPPELSMAFNPTTRDLQFWCRDAAESACVIKEKNESVTLTDKAGNSTKVIFAQADRKRFLRAEIESVTYNGKKQRFSKNGALFYWQLDKDKKLARLYQFASSRRDYYVLADFAGKNTVVTSLGKGGVTRQVHSGLRLLTVTTAAGDLEWSLE